MKKKFISIFLSLLTAGGCFSALSASAKEIEFDTQKKIGHIEQVQENNLTTYYDENGQEIDITALNNDVDINEQVLPSSYDLRDYQRVTSVKDQNPHGLCWDFASTASMESNILSQTDLSDKIGEKPSEKLDISEGGNSWYIHTNTDDKSSILYNDYINDPDKGTEGGFPSYIAQGLSSGYGTYPESLMPYEQYNTGYSEALRFYSDYRLKDYIELSKDTALIKKKIMENGAATIHYNCFSSNTYMVDGIQSYYDDGNPIYSAQDQSHVVAIVGWDDNFSKENFNPLMQPQNDGAWLCKNSWGEDNCSTAEGYKGYFWMSYETQTYEITQFLMQGVDEYDNIYQLQSTAYDSLSADSAANIFTAKSDEKLEQISFYTNGAAKVGVQIYRLNEDYNSPVDGKLISSFDAETDFTGIHSFDCPDDIKLSAGDTFSVVLNSKSQLQIKYRDNSENEIERISYYSTEDEGWVDVSDNYIVGYMSIKAFTSNINGTDKTKLEELIKTSQETTPDSDTDIEIIEELNTQIEASQAVIDNDSASQNDVDNAYCMLNNSLKKITDHTFTINSVEDYYDLFDEIENKKNTNIKNIVLNTDLDLSGREITPLFSYTDFTGVFDGKGHTISNFTLVSYNYKPCGFFGSINEATIKNITFSDCKALSNLNIAFISPISINSLISDCHIKNSTIKSSCNAYGFINETNGCKIENSSISNTKIYGDYNANLFYSAYSVESSVLNNCKATGNELYSYMNVSDNINSNIDAVSTDNDYFYRPIVKFNDEGCTIESFIGTIVSAESEQADITLNDGNCSLKNISGDITINLSYEDIADKDYSVIGDIETKEVLLSYYNGNDTDMVFPSQITGNPITGFSQDFMLYNNNIKSITIPGTYNSIPYGIFRNMLSLESVILEEGVKHIDDSAFESCVNLSSIALPDSLTVIGASAFSGCANLKNITFGKGLEFIGNSAFAYCESLLEPKMPDSLKEIGDYAFSKCTFKSITLDKNIAEIGEKAFGFTGMTELDYKSIFIPEFVINGYNSTPAEEYANENGLRFVDIKTQSPIHTDEPFDYGIFIKGDINLDGKINIDDVTLLNKWLAGIEELNQVQLCNAIVCEAYSKIDIDCATNIQKYLSDIINSLDGSAAG